MKAHPYADLFPMMPAEEIDALADDIVANGQREPVIILDGQILDGRNRFAACRSAGVTPILREYDRDPDTALQYVMSLNLHRRHLSESQRAMVAAKLATMGHGGDRKGEEFKSPIGGLKQSEAADMLNVGERSVSRARKVQEHGAPELARAVEDGLISVSVAEKAVTAPAETQRKLAELAHAGDAGEIKELLTEIRHQNHELVLRPPTHNPFAVDDEPTPEERERITQLRQQLAASSPTKEEAERRRQQRVETDLITDLVITLSHLGGGTPGELYDPHIATPRPVTGAHIKKARLSLDKIEAAFLERGLI